MASLYDSTNTGFITAVTTHGTADVVIPATGRVGKHVIELLRSPFGQPYLALTSSPYAKLPSPQFIFTVTDGAPVMPAPIAQQEPPAVARRRAQRVTAPSCGSIPRRPASSATPRYTAAACPPTPSVDARLHRDERFAGHGGRFTQATTVPFKTVTTDAEGAFDTPFPIPDALGGQHRLEAKVNSDQSLRPRTSPSRRSGCRSSRPRGRSVPPSTLHVKGIGWTQTNNIFARGDRQHLLRLRLRLQHQRRCDRARSLPAGRRARTSSTSTRPSTATTTTGRPTSSPSSTARPRSPGTTTPTPFHFRYVFTVTE